MSELTQAVAALWSIFPQRFIDDRHTESSLRNPKADLLRARLERQPKETLSPEDLSDYCALLVTWTTDARGFKYALPRAAQLLTTRPPGLSFSRFTGLFMGAHLVSWPAGERAGVESFLLALWRHELSEETPEAVEFLLNVEMLGLPLDRFLAAWAHATSPSAARALARLATSFWTRPVFSAAHQQDLAPWLLAEARSSLQRSLAAERGAVPEIASAIALLQSYASG